jgi:hypothetical protein
MRGQRLVPLLVMFAVAGCGQAGGSAQDYAKLACTAYRETSRVQVATTSEQTTAMLDLARSNARAAAAFDHRWASLYSDIQAVVDSRQSMQGQSGRDANRFFDIDNRVQDDCRDAGRDIGNLTP